MSAVEIQRRGPWGSPLLAVYIDDHTHPSHGSVAKQLSQKLSLLYEVL